MSERIAPQSARPKATAVQASRSWLRVGIRGLRGAPSALYFLAGLGAGYYVFSLWGAFLRSDVMLAKSQVPHDGALAGGDLQLVLGYGRLWLLDGRSLYATGNPYPPLANVLLAPLLLLSQSHAYQVVLTLTFAASALSIALLPRVFTPDAWSRSALWVVLTLSFSSYGLHFELERGQFNVIAMALCFGAIAVFHRYPRRRLLAYALFTCAVQLKVYPVIMVVLLCEPGEKLRIVACRWVALAAANVACLFALGADCAKGFLRNLAVHSDTPYVWLGNHSVKAFARAPGVYLAKIYASGYVRRPTLVRLQGRESTLAWLQSHEASISLLLTALVLVLFGAIWWGARRKTAQPVLVLAGTLCCLVLPGTSHDYTLSILPPAMAAFLCWAEPGSGGTFGKRLLVFLGTFAYTGLQASYVTRPTLFMNVFPLLLALLVLCLLQLLLTSSKAVDSTSVA
jgi:hypothetical protein